MSNARCLNCGSADILHRSGSSTPNAPYYKCLLCGWWMSEKCYNNIAALGVLEEDYAGGMTCETCLGCSSERVFRPLYGYYYRCLDCDWYIRKKDYTNEMTRRALEEALEEA